MEKLFRYILGFLIITVAGFQFVQVIMRYVFETPIMGLDEMAVIATLWLYALGAVNASREDTQIRANVLEIFLSTERAHHILLVVSETISLVISIWLTSWAWDYLRYALRVNKETATLYLPTIIYESALFLALLMMSLYVTWHLYGHVRVLLRGDKEPNNPIDHLHTSEVDVPKTLDTHEEKNHG